MNKMSQNKKEITLEHRKANRKIMAFLFPVLLILGAPFYLIWNGNLLNEFVYIVHQQIFITLVFLLAGVLLHEVIHGLFWSFFLKAGLKSIKIGIAWKSLTPYCHSKEPIKLKYYRLGAIMPCIVLGIIPYLISLITGSMGLFLFGFFFTIAAGGDILMIWLLRKESKNVMVQDHPEKIGCTLYY